MSKSRSPFNKFANAVLSFQVGTGKFADDALGNSVEVTKALVVTALLEPKSSDVRETRGSDGEARSLKGYLVSPLSLPDSIIPGMVATIEMKETTTRKIRGTFTLKPSAADPYVIGAGVDLINPIEGEMRQVI